METSQVQSGTRVRTITWDDPRTIAAAAQGNTGLEVLREVVAGRVPAPPMGRLMNIRLTVANRGEVAVRLARALRDLGIGSVAVHARDDAQALHVQLADVAVALDATGPSAYLDGARLIEIARAQGCDAVHPGYGFLSERADFAQACADAGLVFIGPTAEQLGLFGDKARARALAQQCDVPVMPGSKTTTSRTVRSGMPSPPDQGRARANVRHRRHSCQAAETVMVRDAPADATLDPLGEPVPPPRGSSTFSPRRFAWLPSRRYGCPSCCPPSSSSS